MDKGWRNALFSTLLILAACEYQITGYPEQPAMIAPPIVTDASVHVHWLSGVDAVQEACKSQPGIVEYACARWTIYGQTSVCDVYAVEPRDFGDEAKLATLGHELFHCLGAQH